MKIVKDAQRKLVTPAQMQDGEIGVIRKWGEQQRRNWSDCPKIRH